MPDILRYIKKHQFAYPGFDEAETEEGWDRVLDELIDGWEAGKQLLEDKYYELTGYKGGKPTDDEVKVWTDAMNADQVKFEAMMPLFAKFWFHLDIG